MNNRRVGVVLPYNTPSLLFDEISSKLFHPATILLSSPKGEPFRFPRCFAGYGSILLGVKMGMDVTVMVDKSNPLSTSVLRSCIDNFIDPENPFADVSVQETSHITIAGQLEDFFSNNEMYDSALLVWPYQTFDVRSEMFSSFDDAVFVFTHPLVKLQRSKIPECIVVAPRDMNADKEMDCANALSVGTVDSMLGGSFTRVVSMVEVYREDFEKFCRTSLTPGDISVFLGEYLKGKRGILLDPSSHSFIV